MSTSEQRSGDQVAGARLSKVEQENLWQLFKPTALDLLRVAAGHSASRPIEEGEDAVQEVFLVVCATGGARPLGLPRQPQAIGD